MFLLLFLLAACGPDDSVSLTDDTGTEVKNSTRYDCEEDWDWQYTATGEEAVAPVGIVRGIPADADWEAHTGWYNVQHDYETGENTVEVMLTDYHYTVEDVAGLHILFTSSEDGQVRPYEPPTNPSSPGAGDDICYVIVFE